MTDHSISTRPGHVYFVACEPLEAVKIGFTSGSVEKRVAGLQCGNPARLMLLASVPGTFDDEWRFHAAFSFLHIRGEWYRLRGKLRELVDYLSEDGSSRHSSRERLNGAVWDVLYVGNHHPDEPAESAEIYSRTGDWWPFEHLIVDARA